MSRTRATLTALTLVPALLVAGCSDDDPEPKFEPPPSSEAPTSASPSPTATPAMGPEETVRAWVDAQNVALRTGDTADLRSLSSGHCRGCDDFIKPIEQVYRNGGHYETAGWVVEAAKAHGDTDVPVEVDVGVTIAGGKTVLKAGERPISYETEKRILLFKVEPGADGSTVAFVGFVE